MVTWGRTALLLAIALPVDAGAQYTAPVPRRGLLSDLFEGGHRTFAPSFALVGRESELGVDGTMNWEHAAGRPGVLLRVGAFGRRISRESWGGAGAGIGYRFVSGAARFWVGVDGTTGRGTGPTSAVVVNAGGRLGRVRMELRSAWWRGTVIGRDSLGRGSRVDVRSSRHTEAEVSAEQRLGPLSVEVMGGVRFGQPATQDEWGWVTLATSVRRPVDLFASVGKRSRRPDRGGHQGNFVQIGLRFQVPRTSAGTAPPLPRPPLPPQFLAERREGDEWVLTFQIASARTVELTGDLTGWTRVSLTRVRGKPALWQATIRAAPGVYHIAFRIDQGPWWAPPGLPAVPDGFNGLAGLLELR